MRVRKHARAYTEHKAATYDDTTYARDQSRQCRQPDGVRDGNRTMRRWRRTRDGRSCWVLRTPSSSSPATPCPPRARAGAARPDHFAEPPGFFTRYLYVHQDSTFAPSRVYDVAFTRRGSTRSSWRTVFCSRESSRSVLLYTVVHRQVPLACRSTTDVTLRLETSSVMRSRNPRTCANSRLGGAAALSFEMRIDRGIAILFSVTKLFEISRRERHFSIYLLFLSSEIIPFKIKHML